MSKARHARPSKASRAVKAAGAAAVPGVAAVVLAVPAQAATAPQPEPRAVTQVIQDNIHVLDKASVLDIYQVRPGDSLSGIARSDCGSPADWTGIYERNKSEVKDPDLIYAGQQLVLDCADVPVNFPVAVQQYEQPQQQYQQPAVHPDAVVNPDDYSGFQQCVISRESGGNSQVMNSTGHYGLYQFSASTWAAYGGEPADFGHASVEEQNRVFGNAMAQGGEGNWSPYDGC